MSVVVAKRYAKSAFSLAKEKNNLETTYKEINSFLEIFKSEISVLNFLNNPVLAFMIQVSMDYHTVKLLEILFFKE